MKNSFAAGVCVCAEFKSLGEWELSWNSSRKLYISIGAISIVCCLLEHHPSPELSLLSV